MTTITDTDSGTFTDTSTGPSTGTGPVGDYDAGAFADIELTAWPSDTDSGSFADEGLAEYVAAFELPVPLQGPRHLYTSIAKLFRLTATLDAHSSMGLTWGMVDQVLDPWLGIIGQFACRLELGFVRRADLKMPLVAGRAPDRTGILYFDPVTDSSGALLVKAGDRITMVSGPVYGTFEIRTIPDVAQGYAAAHHVEVQVVEVSQALSPASRTPFPGGSS